MSMNRPNIPLGTHETAVLQLPLARHPVPDPPLASNPVSQLIGTKLPKVVVSAFVKSIVPFATVYALPTV